MGRTTSEPPPAAAASVAGVVLAGIAAAGAAGVATSRRSRRLGSAAAQLALAFLCWGTLAGIAFWVDAPDPAQWRHPADDVALGAFCGALFGALFFTFAPLLRAVSTWLAHSRVYKEAAVMHARRQAMLLAAFVVLNALFQVWRAWSLLTAMLLLGMFVVVEIVALARR